PADGIARPRGSPGDLDQARNRRNVRFVTVRRHATRKRHHAVSVVPHDPYAWVGNQLGVSCASARRRGGGQERSLLGDDCEIDLDVTAPLPDVAVRREREVVLPDQLDCADHPPPKERLHRLTGPPASASLAEPVLANVPLLGLVLEEAEPGA